MSLVLQSSGGGSVTLEEPVTASNFTITVPAVTGTMITTASTFAGTGPLFSAGKSATQSVSNVTFTKIIFDAEQFDTASNYDVANGRFTPTVAGYYQFNSSVGFNSQSSQSVAINFYKNGSIASYVVLASANSNGVQANGSALIYCNGSTDYVELFAFQNSGGSLNVSSVSYFQGFLARAA
jgi:hypothetical protein